MTFPTWQNTSYRCRIAGLETSEECVPMLKKCANPECNALFRKFGVGKLLRVDRRNTSPLRIHIEFYWLCAECAESTRLVIGPDAEPTVVRREVEKAAAAAA